MDFAFHTFISAHIHVCGELSATGASGEVLLPPGEWHTAVFAKANPQSATLLIANIAGK